jgi:hypothetical protein
MSGNWPGLPPFGRLAAVVVSGRDPAALEAFVREAAAAAPNAEGVEIYGPADAPMALVRGRRRKRFLVRADRQVDLSAYMRAWRARLKPRGSIRVAIDHRSLPPSSEAGRGPAGSVTAWAFLLGFGVPGNKVETPLPH